MIAGRGAARRRPGATSRRVTRRDLPQLRRLFAFVKPYRKHLSLAMIGVVVASALGLVFPRIMGSLVDTALEATSNTSTLDRLALILIGVFLLQAGFNVLRGYYLSAMGEGVVADMRTAVYAHLMTLPVKFFDSRKTGEITSRLTSDVAVVQGTMSNALAQAIAQFITLIGGVILMFITSFSLSLMVLAFLPIAFVVATVFGRKLARVSTVFQDKVAEATADAEESIAAIRVVQWFTAERQQVKRYADAVGASYRVALRRAKIRAILVPTVTFVAFGTLAVVLWVGGRMVLSGSMTAGDLVTFLLYTLTVAGAIGTFTGLYSQLQETLGASSRIFQLLDEVSDIVEPAEPVSLGPVEGRIVFDGVTFSYSDRDVQVLTDVNLEVRPGEVVALVGPSGAGKSTFVQLIPRFYDPIEGTVSIDGVDVRKVSLADLRGLMAAVPQETQLFSGTITDNLLLGVPGATADEVRSAAVAANAHDFISEFPDGYDTLVGERGVKLSGGQRQRVAIARALLKDPKILILDEATSSLDSESEGLVQEALDKLMQGRTTVVIAHRLATVRDADRIVVLDQGKIVEEGSHDELIALGGLYADLAARQFTTDS